MQEILARLTGRQLYVLMLQVALILYSSSARPPVPPAMKDLFNNVVFRILVLSLVAYLGSKDVVLSLMVALGFIITLAVISNVEAKEAFSQLEEFIQYEEFKARLDHE
jgi:hypothetical protein